jgi:hypothetical protein
MKTLQEMDDFCPICGKKAISFCRCFRRDSYCPNNHWWHTCTVHKVKVIGKSDHLLSTMTCTCINKEREN